MKQILLLLLVPCSVWGQNFAEVDKLALYTPPGKTISVKGLSDFLCRDQPDDVHKIRAIYAWVSLNIAYVDSTDERELWATPEHVARQRPERVLRNKTAVCQGYANLFCALALAAGIPCEVVTGLAKDADGEISPIGHAWVAAFADGAWCLLDPTWAVPPPGLSRFKVQDKYFMTPPKQFILNHLPDDPVWQLLENPVTERRFREDSNEEIVDYLEKETEDAFHYKDTLSQWRALDSTQRMFAAEGRILRFNGSNERVLFALGQVYWRQFFDLRNALDSLSNEAIITDTLLLDTLWFERQLENMERYHARARALFARLETPERLEQAEKFYTPEDVRAMLLIIEGDMHTGVFENMMHSLTANVLNAEQLASLQYQNEKARQFYREVERKIDCIKLAGYCFEIWHNRSLMAIQLAQRKVHFAQDIANEKMNGRQSKAARNSLREARVLFLDAIEDCQEMRRKPPRFAFVDERLETAKQGLLTLRLAEIRVDRVESDIDLEEILKSQPFASKKAASMEDKMERIGTSLRFFEDTLRQVQRAIAKESMEILRFNLQSEVFWVQFKLANLRYRMAVAAWENAATQNALAQQREHLKHICNQALQALNDASTALDYLEDSGKMQAASIVQKQSIINKLTKSIRELLDRF